MARTTADISSFAEFTSGEAYGESLYNQWVRQLDIIVQASVLDKDLTAPPGSPSDGDAYFVASTATGAWAGEDGKLAQWFAELGEWVFVDCPIGYMFYVQDESQFYHIDSTGSVTSGPT